MWANAAEALRAFETKREHPPCSAGPHVRKVQRNTYLEYMHDDLLMLRLHKTWIARYTPEGVVLDFDGWRTNVTFARAEEFTPLRTLAMQGLHYVVPKGISWSAAREGASVLFADGITIHCDGTVSGAPMPTAQAQIIDAVVVLPKRLRRWCTRCVRAWDQFFPERTTEATCMDCERSNDGTTNVYGSGAFYRHALRHIEARTPMPIDQFREWASQTNLQGNALCTPLATKLYRTVREHMVRERLSLIDPNFVWLPPGKSSTRRVGADWRDPFH